MKKVTTLTMIILLAVGLIFLGVGIALGVSYTENARDMVEVQGTIVGFMGEKPVVAYTFGEVSSTYIPGSSSSSYRVGGEYTLMVDPQDPYRAEDPGMRIVSWVFGVMGGVLVCLGLVIGLAGAAGIRRREELLGWGQRALGRVIAVEPNSHVSINGRHPLRLKVEVEHPVTREKITVKSHDLWATSFSPGDTVEVAFDPMNEKRYAVDAQEARA